MNVVGLLIFLLLSYLLGAVPIGLIIGKVFKGIDIRQHGSGNIGATNVFRTAGKIPGLVTLLFDILKGFIPVWFMLWKYPTLPIYALLAGAASISGHTWSVFLDFHGGKGVATTTGMFLALAPIPTVIAALVFFILVFTLRYVSVGSIVSVIVFPIILFFARYSGEIIFFAVVLSGFVIIRHRSNIRRLLQGTENRFNWKSKLNPVPTVGEKESIHQ